MSSKLSDILKLFAWNNPKQQKGDLKSPKGGPLRPKVIKLNFRDIGKIDLVDPIYHDIVELSLNHNHLRSLDGIEQFRNLRSLHLNFNQLHSSNELLKLLNP